MTRYHVAHGSTRSGPFALEQLRNVPLAPDTLVWHAGMDDWVRAEQVPELKGLLEDLPPPLPPPIATTSSRHPDDDFLIAHPALPKMAGVICLYAVVVSPAQWAVQNLLCLFNPLWSDPAGPHQSAAWLAVVEALLAAMTTIVLVIGGLRLGRLRPSGPKFLKVGFALDVAGWSGAIVVAIAMAAASVAAAESSPSQNGPAWWGDVVRILLTVGTAAFEIVALIWILRNADTLAHAGVGAGEGGAK